jgi:cell pole-organizing protein PopZ
MEEILASIRRIIADVPAKTHNNDSSGVDEVHGEGPRLVVGRSDPPRRNVLADSTEPIPTAEKRSRVRLSWRRSLSRPSRLGR